MTKEEELLYYKEAYEREKARTKSLVNKLDDAQRKCRELEGDLSRIKDSIYWRLSKPLRVSIHWFRRTRDRIFSQGNVRGLLRKMKVKRIEMAARTRHGTASFPDEQEAERQRQARFDRDIRFSILMPLYNTPERFLRQAIESVTAQTYGNWELCMADGSDAAHGYVEAVCREYMERDGKERRPDGAAPQRIVYKRLEKNQGISANTNACLAMASGQYIALLDHDDILHPSALYEYMKAICERDADYIYCDETTFKGNKTIDAMITMHFKPDYAPDNLRANNYICHFSAFSRELLDGDECFRPRFDGSQDHDMALRLTDRAQHVVHVPKILYYWRCHEGSVSQDINSKSYAIEAAKNAVAAHLSAHGFQNFEISSTRACVTNFRIKYEVIGDPKVSIVIPNKDHLSDLRRCLTSIMEKTTYSNFEIIIVENNSVTDEIFAYYREIQENAAVRVITYKGDFNYSRINNFGVSYASGEYVLLLNNDTEVIALDWIEELLMYAQREDVGAVGAKLFFRDRSIQHGGVMLGLGAHRTAGHIHYQISDSNPGYMGRLCYAQDITAVTGACLMVKKSLYEAVGGFDESFAVSLNDVDFCLKLRQRGLLNIFTPFAELYHYESVSRGADDSGENAERYNQESKRFREKWKQELEAGDPYYNPNLSLDRSDFALRTE